MTPKKVTEMLNKDEQEQNEQNEEEGSKSTPDNTQNGQGEEQELILGKFKTQADLEKSYTELEKKQGGFADVERERDEYRKYATQVQPVINQIENDEDLANIIREKMGLKVEKTELKEQPQVEVQEIKQRLDRVESRDRVNVVQDFEKKYGIDSLEEGARKEIRSKIEGRLNRWGKSARSGNSNGLAGHLEDAYALENNSKQIEQARNEAIIKTKQNELGISADGNSVKMGSTTEVTLSPEERETARKQGIADKDYLAAKTEIMKEKGLIK